MKMMPLLSLIVAMSAVFASSANSSLPDGSGVVTLQGACSSCYQSSRNSGRTADDGRDVVGMAANVGVPVRASEAAATIVPASDIHVAIKEWRVPTSGSHPHDPLATRDGAICYTGQMANLLGRLGPKTGQFREYRLKILASGPHGLVSDANGAIWFTASFKGYIGKLDPVTGDVREFRLPDPTAQGPHTRVFDRKGVLWITVIGGNMIGRLDPSNGEIKLVLSPTSNSLPYGLLVNSKGAPFFAEFGSNKIGRVDPETMRIEEYVLPNVEARPRRIAAMSDDLIWYSDYPIGYLGGLDPKIGKVTEGPSPGWRDTGPYAITAIDDVIWYAESAMTPNMLVRFDPTTETSHSWPIPSGGGVIRNMTPTPGGGLALSCVGVDTVALVEISKRAN
jgi:virginiamycin B lyase